MASPPLSPLTTVIVSLKVFKVAVTFIYLVVVAPKLLKLAADIDLTSPDPVRVPVKDPKELLDESYAVAVKVGLPVTFCFVTVNEILAGKVAVVEVLLSNINAKSDVSNLNN